MTTSRRYATTCAAILSFSACSAAVDDGASVRAPELPPIQSTPPSAPSASIPEPEQTNAPLEIQPIDLATWMDASRSPAREITLPLPQCIADHGGCPYAVVELPACPKGQTYLDLSEDVLRALDGKTTVIHGSLGDLPMFLAVDCEPQCCRRKKDSPQAFWLLPIGTPPKHRYDSVRLRLVNGQFPYAFACQRDESAKCCDLAPETEVLAYGTIRKANGRLENPHLCRFTQ